MKKNARLTLCGVLLLSAMALAAPTKRFNILSRSAGTPKAALVQATDGNLYGTSTYQGTYGAGTVFRLTPDGTLTTLYNFCPQTNCPDGGLPTGVLIQGSDGNLYGTTQGQGVTGYSKGTIFKMSLDGVLTTLHSFNGTDGAQPIAGLIQGVDGNFYGTTYLGGSIACGNPSGCGTIFEITPAGVLTTLYNFCSQSGCVDGGYPEGGLVQDVVTGDFYGTTYFFGVSAGGTVFKLSRDGTLTTLHSFSGPDGLYPMSGLLQASNGILYGTTNEGGGTVNCYLGCGTIYEITRNGAFTTLYYFSEPGPSNPYMGALIQGTDGRLYGTTFSGGGSGDDGTVFRISLSGNLTVLFAFDGNDGASPHGGLVEATNGTFYGTTSGMIFDLIGLNPFVKMQPNYGTSGAQINVLGTELTGATAVTFNGLPAQFTVQSPSLITATVPAGATSGPIIVTLPGQTLSSTFPFYVRP